MAGLLRIIAVDGEGAAAAVPAWLPWALVAAGVVLLGAVAVMLARGRGGRSVGSASPQARVELAELQSRLVEVKRLAATVADDLDKRAERLERLIARADELLQHADAEPPPRVRSPRSSAGPAPVDDLTQRVFALADQGRTPVQIAQALRQPIGNIELMLALRGDR